VLNLKGTDDSVHHSVGFSTRPVFIILDDGEGQKPSNVSKQFSARTIQLNKYKISKRSAFYNVSY
jgi:hypothetical protein